MRPRPIHVAAIVLPLLAGLFFLGYELFRPLDSIGNGIAGPFGTCGPGYQSDNALEVIANPDVVNQPDGLVQTSSIQTGAELKSACYGQAKNLATYGVLGMLGGLGLAVADYVIIRMSRPEMRF